jgi:hypothetical protein
MAPRDPHNSSSSVDPEHRRGDVDATEKEVSEALEWSFGGEGSGLRSQGAAVRARALAQQLRSDIPPGFSGAIAIAGQVGSQKRQLADLLHGDLGWRHASFGRYVRKIASTRGTVQARPALQDLGEQLISERGFEGFARDVLEDAGISVGREPVIIDGVRHRGIRDALAGMFDPLRLLYIDAPAGKRRSRIRHEDHLGLALWKVRGIERHSTEDDLDDLRRAADQTVAGDDLDVAHLEALRALDSMVRE